MTTLTKLPTESFSQICSYVAPERIKGVGKWVQLANEDSLASWHFPKLQTFDSHTLLGKLVRREPLVLSPVELVQRVRSAAMCPLSRSWRLHPNDWQELKIDPKTVLFDLSYEEMNRLYDMIKEYENDEICVESFSDLFKKYPLLEQEMQIPPDLCIRKQAAYIREWLKPESNHHHLMVHVIQLIPTAEVSVELLQFPNLCISDFLVRAIGKESNHLVDAVFETGRCGPFAAYKGLITAILNNDQRNIQLILERAPEIDSWGLSMALIATQEDSLFPIAQMILASRHRIDPKHFGDTLIDAARKNYIRFIKEALASGRPVHSEKTGKVFTTALGMGHFEIVEVVLQSGLRIPSADLFGAYLECRQHQYSDVEKIIHDRLPGDQRRSALILGFGFSVIGSIGRILSRDTTQPRRRINLLDGAA